MELKDKVAIITGASSGIGAAIAHNLNEVGVKLVLTGRSEQKLSQLASQLQNAVIVPGEITDPALPKILLNTALEKFGDLDIVINNAGIMHMMSIEEADIEALCNMIRVNYEAVVRICYTVLPHLKKKHKGFIVNMSSISGVKTTPMIGVYDGTKHAVEAFTDSLRMELAGSGVGVATVEPGAVATNLYQSWRDSGKQGYDELVPEPLQSDDVARCVRFILEQPPSVILSRLLVVPATSPV